MGINYIESKEENWLWEEKKERIRFCNGSFGLWKLIRFNLREKTIQREKIERNRFCNSCFGLRELIRFNQRKINWLVEKNRKN